ncbi:hypothetical protein Dip518_001528 [Parelusimicrobium proximum]|uniref:hypothetical protein n=1 Tax=Parelusimicrobium proximum TaxID=3228953 RepID=UPI003D176AB6
MSSDFDSEFDGKETSLVSELSRPVGKGHRRIFLLTLAIAVLMQAVAFLHMQVSSVSEELSSDMKILLTFTSEPDSAFIDRIGNSLSANPDIDSLRFVSSEDGLDNIRNTNPKLADTFVFIGRKVMPEYFEIKLNFDAIADIEGWLKTNVKDPFPTLDIRYKEDEAKVVVYMHLIENLLNFVIILFFVVILAFVLFVEAYQYCEERGGRWKGSMSALLAFAVSLAIFWVLCKPFGLLSGGFIFTTYYIQGIIAFTLAILGYSLVKWQRF